MSKGLIGFLWHETLKPLRQISKSEPQETLAETEFDLLIVLASNRGFKISENKFKALIRILYSSRAFRACEKQESLLA